MSIDVDFEVARRSLAVVGPNAHIFCMGEDLGTQRGPIINPDIYRAVIKPRHQRYIDEAKRYGLLAMYEAAHEFGVY